MSDFRSVKPPDQPAVSGKTFIPSREIAAPLGTVNEGEVFISQDALLRIQMVARGLGQVTTRSPLTFRPDSDLDAALEYLGRTPHSQRCELVDVLGRAIWCEVCYERITSPLEIDLDKFYGQLHRNQMGSRYHVELNGRGDVLEIYSGGVFPQENLVAGLWKAILKKDIPLAPTPIALENVHIRNGLRHGFHDEESHFALLYRRPPGDYVELVELLNSRAVGLDILANVIGNMRRIVYGLRRRGVYAVDTWNFLIDRATGNVVLGNVNNPVLTDVDLLAQPITIPESVLDFRLPYLSTLMGQHLDLKGRSISQADTTMQRIDEKLRRRFHLPWQQRMESNAVTRALIADEYVRELQLKIRLSSDPSPWWDASARTFFASLFGGKIPAEANDAMEAMSEEFEKYCDWPLGGDDLPEQEYFMRESLYTYMYSYFRGLPRYQTHHDLVNLAVDIVHLSRMEDQSLKVVQTPPVEVLRPVVERLVRAGDGTMIAESAWPDFIMNYVHAMPYVSYGDSPNWSYAMGMLTRVENAFRAGMMSTGGMQMLNGR